MKEQSFKGIVRDNLVHCNELAQRTVPISKLHKQVFNNETKVEFYLVPVIEDESDVQPEHYARITKILN